MSTFLECNEESCTLLSCWGNITSSQVLKTQQACVNRTLLFKMTHSVAPAQTIVLGCVNYCRVINCSTRTPGM